MEGGRDGLNERGISAGNHRRINRLLKGFKEGGGGRRHWRLKHPKDGFRSSTSIGGRWSNPMK